MIRHPYQPSVITPGHCGASEVVAGTYGHFRCCGKPESAETHNPAYLEPPKDGVEKVLDLLFAGLQPCDQNDNVRAKLRQAYLFGRTDQAAKNYDDLLKSMRKEA